MRWQEYGVATEGERLAQGHADAYSLCFCFRSAVKYGLTLIRRLADHDGSAAESRVALALHSDGEMGDEDTGDTHCRGLEAGYVTSELDQE
jgi:hypothetical protein